MACVLQTAHKGVPTWLVSCTWHTKHGSFSYAYTHTHLYVLSKNTLLDRLVLIISTDSFEICTILVREMVVSPAKIEMLIWAVSYESWIC